MPYNVAENLVECGGTGQGIEPAATSESRPVSCPGGFFLVSGILFLNRTD